MQPHQIRGALVPSTKTAVSACDSCKRRKSKCSGEQPCRRCNASSIVCTYGNSTARARTVDYLRHLESRVADLEVQLTRSTLRSSDFTNGYMNSQIQSNQTLPRDLDGIDTLIGPDHDFLSLGDGSTTYYGRFAGLNVLRIVMDKCENLAYTMAPLFSGKIMAEAFVKDNSLFHTDHAMPLEAGLPDLAETRRLCYLAIEEALPCHECIDRDDFFSQLPIVYAKPSEDLDPSDRAFLALVFALLGFAKRYDAYDCSTTEAYSNHVNIPQGWGFYQSSIRMLQLGDQFSLDMLRTIIYQVLYLAASCMLSKAYAQLSIGVGAALRIGLHVSNPSMGPGIVMSPEHLFRRRQIFSLLYAIDTYLASVLGAPKLFHQVDTDQILPLREEYMHDRGIAFVHASTHTPEAETLVGCQILSIMAEIHSRREPFSRAMVTNGSSGTYELTSGEVALLDAQLTEWYNSLPPVDEIPPVKRALHAQFIIRHTYAMTQMSLHRPFLHHLIRKANDRSFCMDGYAYGSHCITAAMQSVWLLQHLDEQGLLNGSIWFYISSLASAASFLIFFVLGSPYSTTVQDAKEAAFKAHGLLAKLGRENEAAQKCFESIDSLMSQANIEMDE